MRREARFSRTAISIVLVAIAFGASAALAGAESEAEENELESWLPSLGVSFDVHSFRIQVGSESGEYWRAFAWTMLFGLSFATIMTLVIVPSMLVIKYRFLEKRRNKKALKIA